MSSAKRPAHATIDEYLAQECEAHSRSEYINGWIRAMVGTSLRHDRIVGNCFLTIGTQLKGKPCQAFTSATKLRIQQVDSVRFYYPDMQVVCQSNPLTAHYQDHPVLLIEVLSPTTRRYDLDEKMNAYLSIPSLECYLIVEQHRPTVICMRRSTSGFVRNVIEGTSSTVNLPFIHCTMSLQDMYSGVEFSTENVQEWEEVYEFSYDDH